MGLELWSAIVVPHNGQPKTALVTRCTTLDEGNRKATRVAVEIFDRMVDIGAIVAKVLSGEWDGAMLASEQSAGRLTKGERRSIMKQVSKARKNKSIDEKCVESTCISREVHEEEHEEEGGVGKSNKRKVDESEIERKEIVVESVVMNSKQKKNAIKLLNKELNSCALKKQLNEAKRKVRAALKKG